LKIVKGTRKDVWELTENGAGFIGASISSNFLSYDVQGFGEMLLKLMDCNAMHFWLCKEDGDLAGAVCLLVTPNLYNPSEMLGDIYFIDVFPKYRKRGIAKKLIRVVEDFTKTINVLSLSVSFKSEAVAKHLADSMGYTMFEYKLIKRINNGV
jgi:GNAT superfamily N-acetyltransferase